MAIEQLKWRALKKPTLDLEPYRRGEWKDAVQDLKDGWRVCMADANDKNGNCPQVSNVTNANENWNLRFANKEDCAIVNNRANGAEIPLDILQFWGWPKVKGGVATRRFDLDDKTWASDGGRTWLVCGVRFGGRNFLTRSRLWLNGEEIGEVAAGKTRVFRDVTALVRPAGNELRVEMSDGGDYTGLVGGLHLYHREAPEKSFAVGEGLFTNGNGSQINNVTNGNASISLCVPIDWQGRYRLRLWMEGGKKVPLGVRVNDRRFVKGHDSDFAPVRDLDITDFLRFGETNRIDFGHEWNAGTGKWDVGTVRIDLFPAKRR